MTSLIPSQDFLETYIGFSPKLCTVLWQKMYLMSLLLTQFALRAFLQNQSARVTFFMSEGLNQIHQNCTKKTSAQSLVFRKHIIENLGSVSLLRWT